MNLRPLVQTCAKWPIKTLSRAASIAKMEDKSEDNLPSLSSSSAPQEQDPQPSHPEPFSANFWGRDPRTESLRKTYLISLFRGTLLTAVAILGVLSIYWGAFSKFTYALKI